jgi:dephospho-CoA kinase
MLKVGLTGGIGSGKTTVARIFELLGVPVYYADAASKRLYHSSKELIASLKQHFGENIYSGEQLDRSMLAEIVFNDPGKLELLNSLVHPPTLADARAWMEAQKSPYVIKEAALLFESGSAGDLDYIIGVDSPEPLRIKRAMERDNSTSADIKKRMQRQIEERIKMKLCDFIIKNDELEMVIPQVIALHEKLTTLAASKRNNQ